MCGNRSGFHGVDASSATSVSDEAVTVSNLPPGVYTAHVQAWAVQGATTKSFTLRSFHVKGAVGNWSVAPMSQAAEVGEPLSWTVTTGADGRNPVPWASDLRTAGFR